MKKVLVFGAACFFLMGLVGSFGMMEGEKEIKYVEIELEEEVVIVEPYILDANYEDTIVWYSIKPFALHFGSSSPVNGLVFRGMFVDEAKKKDECFWTQALAGKDARYVVKTAVVHNPLERGGIKTTYFVACANDSVVGIIDPDIVIPPRY